MRGEEKQIFWAPFSISKIGMRYTVLASQGNGTGGTGKKYNTWQSSLHVSEGQGMWKCKTQDARGRDPTGWPCWVWEVHPLGRDGHRG